MTERKPSGASFESWIERSIREAEERGEFDDLPGAGKPLPNRGDSHDEMWWIKQKLEREGLSTEAVLPTPLRLRKEIERLPTTVHELAAEEQVREVVAALNVRIVEHMRAPSGPQIPVALVNADSLVEQWKAARAAAARESRPTPAPEPTPPRLPGRRRRWWQWLLRRRPHAGGPS